MTEYVRVPVEPTEEMIQAAWERLSCATEINMSAVQVAVREAIAAAPQDDELARLEREIAEASAKWVCRTDPWEPWFERERQPKAVRYLELRGLLERHPNHPDLVKVKG